MKILKINDKINFNAGLTKQMKSEIASCNINQIENYLKSNGINTCFKENKTVAWSSLKCFEYFLNLYKKFNFNIGLPKGIFVEDFNLLNGAPDNASGVTNFVPAYLYKTKNIIIPEKTIFFNANVDWDNIDLISDNIYEKGISGTDFFLEVFLHEFMHVVHEDNLIKKMGDRIIEPLILLKDQNFIESFQKKYGRILSKISHYAAVNPLEAVACDLAKSSVDKMDRETLAPKSNLFNLYPYKKRTTIVPNKESKKDKIIRNFWNGKFQ